MGDSEATQAKDSTCERFVKTFKDPAVPFNIGTFVLVGFIAISTVDTLITFNGPQILATAKDRHHEMIEKHRHLEVIERLEDLIRRRHKWLLACLPCSYVDTTREDTNTTTSDKHQCDCTNIAVKKDCKDFLDAGYIRDGIYNIKPS